MRKKPGFTLAELLIALAILGVIATFTIPKILNSQQNSSWKSISKEVATSVLGAYQAYKLQNGASAITQLTDFTPYLNYVSMDTTSSLDDIPGSGSFTCSSTLLCLKMHNGSMLEINSTSRFDGTTNLNAMYFYVDPDGKVSGAGKESVVFLLYYDGKLRTWGSAETGTASWYQGSPHTYNPTPANDPAWFNWN